MDRRRNKPVHHPFWSTCVLLFIIPVLLLFAYFGFTGQTFHPWVLSWNRASLLLGASLIGSVITIPLIGRHIVPADPDSTPLPSALLWPARIVHRYPPCVTGQVVALNLGGALVTLVFSFHLLTRSSTSAPVMLGTVIAVTATARLFAHPVPNVEATLPQIVSPLVAALTARGFIRTMGDLIVSATPVARIGGRSAVHLGRRPTGSTERRNR